MEGIATPEFSAFASHQDEFSRSLKITSHTGAVITVDWKDLRKALLKFGSAGFPRVPKSKSVSVSQGDVILDPVPIGAALRIPEQPSRRGMKANKRRSELALDAFRWRKYGQKRLVSSDNLREYFKCTQEGCPARKLLEIAPATGQILSSSSTLHNHPEVSESRSQGSAAGKDNHPQENPNARLAAMTQGGQLIQTNSQQISLMPAPQFGPPRYTVSQYVCGGYQETIPQHNMSSSLSSGIVDHPQVFHPHLAGDSNTSISSSIPATGAPPSPTPSFPLGAMKMVAPAPNMLGRGVL